MADGDGNPSHAVFQGTGSASFSSAVTDSPIDLAGEAISGGYTVEAFIPWGVVGMKGPPDGAVTALFTVFDNDGESAQRTIVGNVATGNRGLQTPSDWGRLEFEG